MQWKRFFKVLWQQVHYISIILQSEKKCIQINLFNIYIYQTNLNEGVFFQVTNHIQLNLFTNLNFINKPQWRCFLPGRNLRKPVSSFYLKVAWRDCGVACLMHLLIYKFKWRIINIIYKKNNWILRLWGSMFDASPDIKV